MKQNVTPIAPNKVGPSDGGRNGEKLGKQLKKNSSIFRRPPTPPRLRRDWWGTIMPLKSCKKVECFIPCRPTRSTAGGGGRGQGRARQGRTRSSREGTETEGRKRKNGGRGNAKGVRKEGKGGRGKGRAEAVGGSDTKQV